MAWLDLQHLILKSDLDHNLSYSLTRPKWIYNPKFFKKTRFIPGIMGKKLSRHYQKMLKQNMEGGINLLLNIIGGLNSIGPFNKFLQV